MSIEAPKFTPGPWNLLDKRMFGPTEEGQTIPIGYVYLSNRKLADAHLIAAAPELYEALERLVRNGQKQGWNDNYSTDMKKASAALAKARGEI